MAREFEGLEGVGKTPKQIIDDIIAEQEASHETVFSYHNRVALEQFSSVVLRTSRIKKTGGRFSLMCFNFGEMEYEGQTVKLQWPIHREDYKSTIDFLSQTSFRIFENDLQDPLLRKTAVEIVDFAKAYYKE